MKRICLIVEIVLWAIIWAGISIPLCSMENVSRDNELTVPFMAVAIGVMALIASMMVGLHLVGFDLGKKFGLTDIWSCVVSALFPIVNFLAGGSLIVGLKNG